MTEQQEEYILEHISPEPEHLARLNRDTHIHCLYSRMCSGHLQGNLLAMLVSMIRPHRILEMGTFTGYSALAMAGAMPPDAELHTVEVDDQLQEFIQQRFDERPEHDRIHLHIGDAQQVVPTLPAPFDLIFIDADKRKYPEYYRMALPLLSPGGYIIADNTLWDWKILDTVKNHDAQTVAIARFNDMVAQDRSVTSVILPLRDGLTIIRKKTDND
ncbi:MAG: O-methyltransferase [Muribaculaceae bacterium]|nr:O-methyltransferase [Muribaculaceae bacterium]